MPFVLALATGIVAFAMLVPWLVHESRRPLAVRSGAVSREPKRHRRLPALVVCMRSYRFAIRRHMEPTPAAAVSQWQTAFTAARARGARVTEGLEARGEPEGIAETVDAPVAKKRHTRAGGTKRPHRGPGGHAKAPHAADANGKNVQRGPKQRKAELHRTGGR
ncbi:MAG: hypothetical protein ACHQIG_14045 [Acidimicrobiia bacterium]